MCLRLFLLVGLVGLSGLLVGGDVSGRVVLKGSPPKERVFPFDVMCSRASDEVDGEKRTRFYVVGEGGGLGEVFVVVRGVEGVFEVPSEPVVLDQVGCVYTPYVLGVRVGQTVLVKNSDPVLHNVHTTPRVAGNRERNVAQLPRGKDLEFVFDVPERFLRFKCDVHPWMFAYVCVVSHPFFAVTDGDGGFVIRDVPVGEYVVEAVHRKSHAPRFVGVSKRVVVGADGGSVDFVVDIGE